MVGSLGGGFNNFSCSSLLVGMIYINFTNMFQLAWNHHLGSRCWSCVDLGWEIGSLGGVEKWKKKTCWCLLRWFQNSETAVFVSFISFCGCGWGTVFTWDAAGFFLKKNQSTKKCFKCLFQEGTLQRINISPWQGIFEDDSPFPQVGYVNFLEGTWIPAYQKNLRLLATWAMKKTLVGWVI